MANKHKPRLIGTVGVGTPQGLGFYLPTLPPGARTLPGRDGVYIDPVVITSDRPKITVIGRMTGKPTSATPKPRYEIVDRPFRTSAVRYQGHDPHTLDIPMMLDKGGATGIERLIAQLEDLMERHSVSDHEPPIVKVAGQGIPHQGLKWRVQPIDDADVDQGLTRYLPDGRRERFAFTLHLLEHVADRTLAQTITGGKPARSGHHRITAHKGDTLYDVARREYGDPSRASDLQHLNPSFTFGTVFKKPTRLRAL